MKTIKLNNGKKIELNQAFNCDCLEFMKELPDKSVGLIMADPPYFEVKGDFDFIWDSFEDYLKDVEKWVIECKRILADNGSLFWWGNVEKIAYSQIIIDKYFKFENHITWRKPDSIQYQYYSVELSRRFNTHNERVLFYSNDYEPSEWNKTGTERIKEEFLKPKNPFAIYMRSEFKEAGVKNRQIAELFPSKTGGLTGCVSNWLNGDNIPTLEQYNRIRDFLNGEYLRKEYEYLRKEYEDLRKEYEDLRKEYEELRKEYEELRRPFNNGEKLEDVITHSQESRISKGYDHETIKAIGLIKRLLQATTRKDTLVYIPFWGSGTDSVAC
ncbi:MAG: site-specific DNA-methyltransferase, partial [PVC group bacterium]|nr:site-specific DNA-methyltransferase [PVC group bacterium]